MTTPAVTRFAPSPTGAVHLGNARTALFSYLWARKTGGRFILRIEDTDVERSQHRYRDELIAELQWLHLTWDEGPDVGGPAGPYVQSERGAIYAALFEQLEAQGDAYPCYCRPEELEIARKLQRMAGRPPRYPGTCRALSTAARRERAASGLRPTLRFAVPSDRVVEFADLVHGPQRLQTNDIGDFIVRREDGTASFFFCNAVDDALMGVTHVLRGDDHLANTPRQLLVLDALGLRRPDYGHVGLLVGADGAPLSKRHGSTSVQEFRQRGFLAAALLNHLVRLGHTGDVDRWLDLPEMPVHFRPEHLGKAPARFDEAQLLHWQKETIARLSPTEVGTWLGAGGDPRVAELLRHNVVLPKDAAPWLAVLRGDLPPLGEQERRILADAGSGFFATAAAAITESGADLPRLAKLVSARTGRRGAALYLPLRLALTGCAHGPELAPLLALIGADAARRRLESHAQDP